MRKLLLLQVETMPSITTYTVDYNDEMQPTSAHHELNCLALFNSHACYQLTYGCQIQLSTQLSQKIKLPNRKQLDDE